MVFFINIKSVQLRIFLDNAENLKYIFGYAVQLEGAWIRF
jgi:hypothetical protein